MFYSSPSFDWYQATIHFGGELPDSVGSSDADVGLCVIPADVSDVLSVIGGAFTVYADLSSWCSCMPRNGWRYAARLCCGELVLCLVSWHNSASSKNCCSVQFSGEFASLGAEILRSNWPGHSVTRLDVAVDLHINDINCQSDPTAFFSAGVHVAEEYGLKTNVVGDWFGAEKGRTLYIGSPKSALMARIYEKGKQLGGSPDWVRFELVYRPQKQLRIKASSLLPEDVLGSCPWASSIVTPFYRELSASERLTVVVDRHAVDNDRALRHMFAQYRKQLIKKAVSFESVTEFTDYFLDCIYSSGISPEVPQFAEIVIPVEFYSED